MEQVDLRAISPGELLDVAKLHIEVFPDNRYSRLGSEVVRRYFEWQLAQRSSVLLTGVYQRQSGLMLGYCFGSAHRAVTAGFMRRHLALVASHLLGRPGAFLQLAIETLRKGTARVRARPGSGGMQAAPSSEQPLSHHCFEIVSLAVTTLAQGSGLGKLLMRDQEGFAEGHSFDCIRLRAPVNSANTIAFYERIGFSKVKQDNGPWDGQMRKSLASPTKP